MQRPIVVIELGEHPLFGLGIAEASDLDELVGTGQSAGPAGGTQHLPILILNQARLGPAKSVLNFGPLQRILRGLHQVIGILMTKGHEEALKQVDHEGFLHAQVAIAARIDLPHSRQARTHLRS